jgi:hypothetical protein
MYNSNKVTFPFPKKYSFCIIEYLEHQVKRGLNRTQFELVDKDAKEHNNQIK